MYVYAHTCTYTHTYMNKFHIIMYTSTHIRNMVVPIN